MKKIIALVLMLILACSFVACGESDGPGGELSDTEKKNFVELYGDWTDSSLEITMIDKGLGTQWLKDAAVAFNRGTGAKINVKADEQLNERLASVVSSKNCSDIYFSFSSELQWIEWGLSEQIVPLTDIQDELTYRNEQVAKLGVYDGMRYIMPYSYNPTGFVYNEEYINEIPSNGAFTTGTFPTTWQGLLDMCESINTKWSKVVLGQKVVPMSWGATVDDFSYIFKGLWAQVDPEGFYNYYNQPYRESVSNGENKSLLINDSTISVLENIAKLLNPQENAQGNYYPANSFSDSLGHSNRDAEQKFLNGLSVFCISGSWFEMEMQEQIEDEEISFYRFTSAPIVNEGSKETVFINTPAEYFMIPTNGKNQNYALAKAFLRYMASESATRVFHVSTGCPCALKYKTPTESLSSFAKNVAEITDRAEHAIGASDQLPSLSGAIGLSTTQLFQALATSPRSTEKCRSLLEEIYAVQKADWKDRFKAFQR